MSARAWPERVDILGVWVDVLTLDEAVAKVVSYWSLPDAAPRHVVTLNPELVMAALDERPGDARLLGALEESSLVVADGIGIVWASRILGVPLPERVPGIELAEHALRHAAATERRVFLLGAKPGVADAAGRRMSERYPGLRVVGVHHGYFKDQETKNVVATVRAAEADLLLVGLGAPRQELWIARHKETLGAKVLIGVGGSLDIFAGESRRAPVAFQRLGLEWAYRLAKEPKRVGRMAALPRFVARVLFSQWQRKD